MHLDAPRRSILSYQVRRCTPNEVSIFRYVAGPAGLLEAQKQSKTAPRYLTASHSKGMLWTSQLPHSHLPEDHSKTQ